MTSQLPTVKAGLAEKFDGARAGFPMTNASFLTRPLVSADQLVVGAVPLLSYAGRGGRHELGIRVFDGPLADQLSSRFTTA